MHHVMLRGLSAALTVMLSFASLAAEVETIRPSRVIDLFEVSRKSLGRSDFKVEMVAQNAGRWAVALRFTDKTFGVFTGLNRGEARSFLPGRFSAMVIDGKGRVILSESVTPSERTYVTEWDPVSGAVVRGVIPHSSAIPVLMDRTCAWKTTDGLFEPATRTIRQRRVPNGQPPAGLEIKNPDLAIRQSTRTVGLPGNRYAVFGSRTERIVVHDSEGGVTSSAKADLNAAYDMLGIDHTVHPSEFERVETGSIRFSWAIVTREGWISVRISHTNVNGPAVLAAFDPSTGRLQRITKVELPSGNTRRRSKWNPEGFIWASLGTYGDGLAVVDDEEGLLALY